MTRPRLISDDAILDATRQVLAELGPTKLTLAAVGPGSDSRRPR